MILSALFLSPWLALLRNRLQGARVRSNQFLFGLSDSGNIHLELVIRLLKYLSHGVTEIYFHPALPDIDDNSGNGGRGGEYETLVNPQLRQALLASDIQQITFSDLAK
jgi:hypothetical protein